jgi:hypothetical protein
MVPLKYIFALLPACWSHQVLAQTSTFQRAPNLITPNTVTAPTQGAQKGVALALPTYKDIYKQADSTVIERNGKRTTVGEIKTRILQRTTIPANAPKLGNLSKQPPVRGKGVISAKPVEGMTQPLGGKAALTSPAQFAGDCTDKPPTLGRANGSFKPGEAIEVVGGCLGDAGGELRLYGAFPSGFRVLPIQSWAHSRVRAQIPASIRGVNDAVMRVELVNAKRQTSNSLEVDFLALRESVDMSTFWRVESCPKGAWERAECNENTLNYFGHNESAKILIGDLPLIFPKHIWHIDINQNCYLESFWWTVAGGVTITSAIGFELGPPYSSVVTVTATPNHWMEGGFFTDTEFYSVTYKLHAKANCPLGVSPRP